MSSPLQAPFSYFGGKSSVAAEVWSRFGTVRNYVEPFFGSGAVLLGRPQPFDGTETVNDKDGMIANFWRAIQHDPETVAKWADYPVFENDLHARHAWLVGIMSDFVPRLEGDPDFYDAKVAGYWVWGMACWIGSGFCSGAGPWRVVDGQLVHLGDAGRGVNRQLVHLGSAGKGVNRKRECLQEWMQALSDRLRRVRVCCGDWSRVCGPTPTVKQGLTAVFLDPPYSAESNRDPKCYTVDDLTVAHDVREWAIAQGNDPLMRIALCGYDGEHTMPDGWTEFAWKASGGYENQSENKGTNCRRERIWFSPHCRENRNLELFA